VYVGRVTLAVIAPAIRKEHTAARSCHKIMTGCRLAPRAYATHATLSLAPPSSVTVAEQWAGPFKCLCMSDGRSERSGPLLRQRATGSGCSPQRNRSRPVPTHRATHRDQPYAPPRR